MNKSAEEILKKEAEGFKSQTQVASTFLEDYAGGSCKYFNYEVVLAAMEAYASQSPAGWVRASERWPDKPRPAKFGHHFGEIVSDRGHLTFKAWGSNVSLTNNDPALSDIIWLDETPSPTEGERDISTLLGTSGGLTVQDANNWLYDELEGHKDFLIDFNRTVELLHNYFIEATKAVQKERERIN